MQTERELKLKIEDKVAEIAKVLKSGRDCEIRTSPNGIAVIAVKKEVVAK